MAIIHHCDNHRNLAWRPIPQPRQMGSLGCGDGAGEILRKSTRGSYGETISHTTQRTAHHKCTAHCTTCCVSSNGFKCSWVNKHIV